MPFLTFSDVDVWFAEKELTQTSLTTVKTLLTTKRVEFIDKKEFAAAIMDKDFETFVVHIAFIKKTMLIHLAREAQIAALQANRTPIEVLAEYSDYIDIFSPDLAIELPKNTGINEHAIKLINEKQPPYGPIYALKQVELKTLKAYIKTHLKTGVIQHFKFLTDGHILFDKKSDGSLRLYIDYQGLNNLTIKNQYPLPLISESLDQLGQIKWFTQLDLTYVYQWMRI